MITNRKWVAGYWDTLLAVEGMFRGTRVELTGFSVPLTQEQAETPQVADETTAVTA
ncbi:hypothetical protein ACWDA7_38765 [Streptomyces sp. NPDC001156]